MQKLNAKTDGATLNIVEQNIDLLRELFPDAFTEGSDEQGPRWKVDFDTLRQILGNYVEDQPERYSFTWNGKSRARRIAQTPSTGTLRPCPEESVNWDTTKNLFIEGDNLEVLKLLQKSYHRKVKMIYIDPPFNTGNDFIYPDDFSDSIGNYKALTGQTDDAGRPLSANAETSGRYHTNWLNMMLPRLKLAKNLLRDDGFIFISIDDKEVTNLRKVADEVFGEEAFLLQFVWRRRLMADSRNEDRASSDHEYVVCYKMPDAKLKGNPIDKDKYSNPDNDPRGPWFSADLTGIANKEERPNLHYDLVDPETGNVYPPSPTRGWSCAKDTMARLISEGRVLWPSKPDGRPRHKKFLNEVTRLETGFSSWLDQVGQTSEGTQAIQKLFGEKVFPFSKPISLVRTLVEQAATEDDDCVLDFFAGSGTTAQAVFEQNLSDGRARRFIGIQLPEPTGRDDYATISRLAADRIQRVGKQLREENPLFGGDIGFKMLKLDASNIKPWDADFDNLEDALFNAVENIKPDRTEADVLYELLLKYGLDLAMPIEQREIDGKTVYIIGAGALVVCLADKISLEVVEGIAALKDELKPEVMRVVFKDAGFADDVVKTNAVQILRQAEIEDVKSL